MEGICRGCFVVNREGLADEAGLSVYKIKLCL